jgi:cell division inhibitor SulA/protein ImuA
VNPALERLLAHPGIFRAAQGGRVSGDSLPSGFAVLDAELPRGGWPVGALTEILPARAGVGELRLLMPALSRLSHSGRGLVWVAPPHVPYAPALLAHRVDLAHLLIVHPSDIKDLLWAMEQSLRSGACGAVLAWVRAADDKTLRRLQLAAEAGAGWAVLFRPPQAVDQATPAALRLSLAPAPGGLAVHILKRRGGWATGPVLVDLSPRESRENQSAEPLAVSP